MTPVKPSRLESLQELSRLMALSVQIQGDTAALLEEYHNRIYVLEEDRKLRIAQCRKLEERCASLEKRYSELLYRFSELKR